MWVIDVIKSAIFWGVTAAKFFFIDHPFLSLSAGITATITLIGLFFKLFDSSGR